MGLDKCRDCGTEVSTQARACPKCGRLRQTSINWAPIVVIAAVLAFIAWRIADQIVRYGVD